MMTKNMKISEGLGSATVDRRDQGSIVIRLVLVAIVFLAITIIWFTVVERPRDYQSATLPSNKSVYAPAEDISATPSATPTPTWETYSNHQYGFSIRYPCRTCSNNPPLFEGDQMGGAIALPTLDDYTQLVLEVITRQGVTVRNTDSLTPGPGQPYQYSINRFAQELARPVGQSCHLYDYYLPNQPVANVIDCTIVMLGERKALRANTQAGGLNWPAIHYILPIRADTWLEASETFYSYQAPATLQHIEDPQIREQAFKSPEEIVHTLTLY